MAALPDDDDVILMAYADGVLDGETRARVEAMLQRDAESLRRVEAFRATGAPLSDLFGKPMQEPVPSNLVDFVLNYGQEGAASANAKRSGPSLALGERPALSARWRKLKRWAAWENRAGPAIWQLAAASAAALIIGVSAGWMLHDGSSDDSASLAAFTKGQVFAGGALRQVLETSPSGQVARIAGNARDATVMRTSLTFRSKGGSFCREYEVATAGLGNFAGLACREEGGKWALKIHVAQANARPGAKAAPADGPHESALDEIVDRMMEGIALGREEEEAAISKGWK